MLVATLLAFTPSINCKAALNGRPFPVQHVRVQKSSFQASAKVGKDVDKADVYFIEFADSDKFMPDRAIKFHLHVNPGTKFDNFRWSQKAYKFGTPEHSKQIHGHRSGTSCGRGAVAMFLDGGEQKSGSASDMIGFTISTKRVAGGGFTATVRASNTELKTWVQGTFTFQVEKI